jgi:hypothetical protein
MSNFRLAFNRPEDGGLSIVCPVEGTSVEVAAAAVPPGVPYRVIDVAAVPSDRTFRNAWECDLTYPDGYGPGGEE